LTPTQEQIAYAEKLREKATKSLGFDLTTVYGRNIVIRDITDKEAEALDKAIKYVGEAVIEEELSVISPTDDLTEKKERLENLGNNLEFGARIKGSWDGKDPTSGEFGGWTGWGREEWGLAKFDADKVDVELWARSIKNFSTQEKVDSGIQADLLRGYLCATLAASVPKLKYHIRANPFEIIKLIARVENKDFEQVARPFADLFPEIKKKLEEYLLDKSEKERAQKARGELNQVFNKEDQKPEADLLKDAKILTKEEQQEIRKIDLAAPVPERKSVKKPWWKFW
jgi:hypothetical protein